MLKIGVLVSGGGTNLQAIINACEENRIDGQIACVISSRSDAYALERAKKHGIPHTVCRKKDYADQKAFEQKIIDTLELTKVDLIVTAGFMTVLSEAFIRRYPKKIMNVHPSLIPSFCGKGFYGLRVHEAALERGVKITGATVHFLDEGCDTGPIILQKAVEVCPDDTPETLQKRVMEEAEWVILPQAIQQFAKGEI